jgi:hypothetical protein
MTKAIRAKTVKQPRSSALWEAFALLAPPSAYTLSRIHAFAQSSTIINRGKKSDGL